MKAYQIVIKGDPISEEYARISRESFKPLTDSGILEIITYDAITPNSDNFEEHVNLYHWSSSLMLADLQGTNPDDHSPTEKAGMCSHWDLIRQASKSDERFLVLEHDTFLVEKHTDVFVDLIERIQKEDIMYANVGLFMGCYSLGKQTAEWMYEMLTEAKGWSSRFPINCGPYCTLQRLFATYTSSVLKPNNFFDLPSEKITTIHPWHECYTLYFGRNCQVPFNKKDPDIENSLPVPTTQVVSKSMKVTQDHHGYPNKMIESPWTRHNYFHVID